MAMRSIPCFFVLVTLLLGGCTVTREVDYSSGSVASHPDSLLFGAASAVPEIGRFMQIGRCLNPSVSADGATVLFVSNMSGVSQLYCRTADGWPHQLTHFPDGIDWYVPSHFGQLAIVGAAMGGSEKTQLILVDVVGGRLRTLTSVEEARYGSVVWSPDDRTIYFRSTVENLRDFKLYRMELESGQTLKLLDLSGINLWLDVSPDGQKLIYQHAESNFNNDIYLYDMVTGQSDYLTPHDGNVIYGSAAFSHDGRALHLTCNDNDRGLNLRARLDLDSKRLTYLEQGSEFNVDTMSLSPDRRIVAWVENRDGFGHLRVADLETGADFPGPTLDGVVSDLSTAGDRAVFTFSSPRQTHDIWQWNWSSEELLQLTHSAYAGVDRSRFAGPELISYRSFDELEIPAFLYLPQNYEGRPVPFIVYLHGGPESQFRPSFARSFQYFLLMGYGIFAPNVRGSDGYGREYLNLDNYRLRMNSVRDMKAGVDWIIEKGYTQPGMIGITGGSYGGYMVMAGITEYPELFSAASSDVGIVNFETFLQNTSPYRRALREAEYGPLSDPEFLRSISPIFKADRIHTPLLVIHGANDPRVPVGEARQIIAAIRSRGGVVDSLIFGDEGHGTDKVFNTQLVYRKMAVFFDKYLAKGRLEQ